MKNFNINRFFQTLKWMIIDNKQKLMLWTAGSTVGVFLLQFFFFYVSPHSTEFQYRQTTEMVMSVCAFFVMLAVLIAVSGLFGEYATKQRRCLLLMLPASNLEKFLSAIVYSSIVSVACILLAFVLGDTLRMLTMALFFHLPLYSGIGTFFSTIFSVDLSGAPISVWELVLFMILVNVLIHATYTLGGTLFRKWPFIITAVIQYVVLMLLVVFVAFLHRNFDISIPMRLIEMVNSHLLFYIACFFLAAVSALFYWLSYRIFCRMQIIGHKWVNV
jgi:hypothetical protein